MSESVLLIAKNWPEPNSTAAGRRSLDLLALLQTRGYVIHVACAAEPTPFQTDLSALGIQTHAIAVNDADFDPWLADLAPAIVIYDRFVMEEQFGWRVQTQLPQAMTLIDTSDLHCLRVARETALKGEQPIDLFNAIALREIAAISRTDISVMISQTEIDLLHQHFHISRDKLLYLPFLVTPPDPLRQPGFDAREHLVMIGGFKHEPNRDATRWLKTVIWPILRPLLPNKCEMHVYGAYADHAMNQLQARKDQFFIKGRSADALATLSQYRLNLAPLRFGAGQKGKILEGWLTGTPTLTTPIGAEAMASESQLGYRPSANPDEFAQLVAAAYHDSSRWAELQSNGYRILEQNFARSLFAHPFLERVDQIRATLSEHRQANFWGRLLTQNQYRATEYMSRWIELKNQLQREPMPSAAVPANPSPSDTTTIVPILPR
ncbi:MAG: glycosyltransferase [Reinekea forsetii]|nr:glycosyltransferase [Reinekea forsetii]